MAVPPNIVPDFSALRVAVVGDLLADNHLFACPTRLSREAPVMVMRHEREEISAGGAANVARNLWSLGARVSLLGVVGRDASGRELLRILADDAIEVDGVEAAAEWLTPTKTRVLGAEAGRTPHQVLRIDREPEHTLAAEVRRGVAERVRALAGKVDGLLISDYGYGVVGAEVGEAALEVQHAGATVVLDPRTTFEPFAGATAMTPNLEELSKATGRRPDQVVEKAELDRAAAEFLARYHPRWLLVTLGNRGMALYSQEHPLGVRVPPSGAGTVVDVSGAGDTAAVAFALGLTAGLEGPRAMRLANAAAGVVVMERGAAVCALSKLRSALPESPKPQVVPAESVAG